MKKFFSAILLMTMMVFSVGTFVSCNDLVNEIEGVKGQATELEAAVDALEAEIATLETALQNAKAEAADAAAKAKAAADEAKKTGDEALKAAQDAAAAAAAAQASADAIEETLAAAKTALQDAIDGKADKADVEAAVKEIEALKAVLEGKADKTDVDALKAELDLLKKTLEGYKDLLAQLEILTPTLDERINYNLEAVTNAQGTADANAEEIAALKDQINDLNVNLTAYGDVIPGLVQMIQSVVYVPENAEGTMVANAYELGDKKSDILVKATYEVTPAKYAAELTDANVKFTTVPFKAEPAEIVEAKIVEAKNGRVTVYARVKNNAANKNIYGELKNANGDGALALMITDEEPATVDSVEYTVGTNVKSAYNTVVSNGYTDVETLVKVYNNVAKAEVTGANKDHENIVYVPYNDLTTVYSPLSIYELRILLEGKYMTIDEAAAFLGYAITAKIAKTEDSYAGTDAIYKVVKDGFASTLQLQVPEGKTDLKEYIEGGFGAAVTLSGFSLNDGNALTLPSPKGKIIISYADASDVKFETYNAGPWSYTYFNGTDHVFVKNEVNADDVLIKELDVTAPNVSINALHYKDQALIDGTVVKDVPMTATYTDADGNEVEVPGKFSFKVLNSKSVMLTAIKLPIIDQALTYRADFTLADKTNKLNYTASFVATVGARPEDKTITLDPMEITALTKTAMTKKVAAITEAIINTDAAYYADLIANGIYAVSNTGTNPAIVAGTPTTTVAFSSFGFDPVPNTDPVQYTESTTITVPAMTETLAKDYKLEQVVTFYGVNYKFVADVKVVEPTYSIDYEASLIKNGVAEVVGKVGFPNWTNTNPKKFASEKFTLNIIDLYDYIYVNAAAAAAINAGEAAIVYQMQKTETGADGKPCVPAGIAPTSTATTTITDATQNILTWGNTAINEVEVVIALVSTLLDDEGAPVKVYSALPVKLWIDDYVNMTLKSTPTSAKFVTGQGAVNQLNVVNSIEIYGTHADLYTGTLNKWGYLYNPAAANVAELFMPCSYKANPSQMETETGFVADPTDPKKLGFAVYGQAVSVEADETKCVAKLASGANYTGKWSVEADGTVTLFDHDSPLVEDVIITVPVTLTHWYGDNQVVNAQVKFLAK